MVIVKKDSKWVAKLDGGNGEIEFDTLKAAQNYAISMRGQVNMKVFYEMYGVGSSRYSVSDHDGIKTHDDGSAFFGIALFKNKRKKDRYIRELQKKGYTERRFVV